MKSEYHVPFAAPLHEQDSDIRTVGCRANNPDICRFYMLDGTCAFTRDDHMCMHPSRSWKKQYQKLKGVK